jgi:hypothetical protein
VLQLRHTPASTVRVLRPFGRPSRKVMTNVAHRDVLQGVLIVLGSNLAADGAN